MFKDKNLERILSDISFNTDYMNNVSFFHIHQDFIDKFRDQGNESKIPHQTMLVKLVDDTKN